MPAMSSPALAVLRRLPIRRALLPAAVVAITLVAGACARTQSPPPEDPASKMLPATTSTPFVYVGGYRPEIRIFRLDRESGALAPAGQVDGGNEPSFLAWDPDKRFLFAVNEVEAGRVVSFAIDPATGGLRRVGQASSAGNGPAHLSVDASGRWVLVANYAGEDPGTIGVLPITADGGLGEAVFRHDFGPNTMPHMIRTGPQNAFVFVPCKGGPYVAQFAFDPRTGQLAPAAQERVASAPDAGPRHLDFHPNGRFAYVINETNMTLSAYTLDAQSGALTEIETVSTLPPDEKPAEGYSTADVHVHPSGEFLYGSNRGHNSLVIYRIDTTTGRLTLVGHERRTIARPRNFHLDPAGGLLLVANQDEANVSIFFIDRKTGSLELAGEPTPAGEKPSFVGVVELPGR